MISTVRNEIYYTSERPCLMVLASAYNNSTCQLISPTHPTTSRRSLSLASPHPASSFPLPPVIIHFITTISAALLLLRCTRPMAATGTRHSSRLPAHQSTSYTFSSAAASALACLQLNTCSHLPVSTRSSRHPPRSFVHSLL